MKTAEVHTFYMNGARCWVTVPIPDRGNVSVQSEADLSQLDKDDMAIVGVVMACVMNRLDMTRAEWDRLDKLSPVAKVILTSALAAIGERLPTRPPEPTADVREALIRADGSEITLRMHRWRLEAGFIWISYPRDERRFYARATILDPTTNFDRKFPITDLANGEGEESARLVEAFAKLGGFTTKS